MVNAIRKADAVAAKYPDTAVIGADTVIELTGKSRKPSDIDDAKRMLRSLPVEKTMSSPVSVCVYQPRTLHQVCRFKHGRFKKLSDADIENYLSKVHVLDKAGAMRCRSMAIS
jgi:septum formation protein